MADKLVGGTKSEAAIAARVIKDNLLAIAPIFSQRKYFLSDDYSLVDCCLAPLMWRLEHYGINLGPQGKALQRYAESVFSREAFRLSLSPFERSLHGGS